MVNKITSDMVGIGQLQQGSCGLNGHAWVAKEQIIGRRGLAAALKEQGLLPQGSKLSVDQMRKLTSQQPDFR